MARRAPLPFLGNSELPTFPSGKSDDAGVMESPGNTRAYEPSRVQVSHGKPRAAKTLWTDETQRLVGSINNLSLNKILEQTYSEHQALLIYNKYK